jgi:hypothetical protein
MAQAGVRACSGLTVAEPGKNFECTSEQANCLAASNPASILIIYWQRYWPVIEVRQYLNR